MEIRSMTKMCKLIESDETIQNSCDCSDGIVYFKNENAINDCINDPENFDYVALIINLGKEA